MHARFRRDFVGQTLDYLQAHLAERVRLVDLAAHMQMPVQRLAREFKRTTGYAPRQVILHARLDAAQTLLRTTQRSLPQIARAVGFCDASHFARRFRQQTGQTPAQYRAEHHGDFRRVLLPRVCALWPRVSSEVQATVLAQLEAAVQGEQNGR
jgi:transcriptional regulator GlxA family with amidase domain